MHRSFFFRAALAFLVCFWATAGLHADVVSFAVNPLPDLEENGSPVPRVDVLSVDLDPRGAELVGQPGETIGWSFKFNWASNAGDSLVLTGSNLGPESEFSQAGVYVDLIGEVGGNVNGGVLANTEWASPTPFTAGTDGIGYFTLSQNAVPGTLFRGTLWLHFKVCAGSGDSRVTLESFSMPLEVSITVASVELTPQTINFPDIPSVSITDPPLALGATSDSQLPITYISLNPDLCTVENGMASFHGAGEVAIIALQEGNTIFSAAEPVTRFFQITKERATVTIQGSMDQTYDGNNKQFAAVTTPAGLPVQWLYDGETTPPREPGIYLIQAVIDDPIYEGTGQARLVITDTSPPPVTSYLAWVQTYFSTQEIYEGLVTAKDVILSSDGGNNLFKYAFGLDPWLPMAPEVRATLPRLAETGTGYAFAFSLPIVPSSDLVIKVEATSDFVTWTEIARRTGGSWTGPASVFTGTPDLSGQRAETFVSESLPSEAMSRFYRLTIESAEP